MFPVVVVFLTIPVPSTARFTFDVPRVRVAVFETPLPPFAAETGVERLMVPVVVTGPPVNPVPVATLVTVPLPFVVHVPPPVKNVVELQVPENSAVTSLAAASVSAPVVVVFFTIPVPRVAKLIEDVPRVNEEFPSAKVPLPDETV
jgi:hypothetical protein